jgi:hypothetical protein
MSCYPDNTLSKYDFSFLELQNPLKNFLNVNQTWKSYRIRCDTEMFSKFYFSC